MRGRWTGLALLLLALVVLLFTGLGGAGGEVPGSARSAARDGRLAAYLLLVEFEHEPELWVEPPGELPPGPHQLWLARAPENFVAQDAELPEDDPLEAARARGPAGLQRYREFMEQGGTLVLPATERVVSFLAEELGLDSEALVAWEPEGSRGFEIEELELGERETAAGTRVVTLSAGEERLAREIPVGAGSCLLIAAGDYLDNDRLGRRDNGLFLLRLAERRAAGGRLLFDEYALGLGSQESSASLAVSPRGVLLSLHLAVLLLVLCWRSAWAREFPRDPEPLDRVSPLARARALATALRRAGRIDTLGEMLRVGDGRRRLGADAPAGPDVSGTPGPPGEGPPRSTAPSNPTTLAGLASLDARLRDLEHAVHRDGNT